MFVFSKPEHQNSVLDEFGFKKSGRTYTSYTNPSQRLPLQSPDNQNDVKSIPNCSRNHFLADL